MSDVRLYAPGWYADPGGEHQVRYHDGSRWTEHVSCEGRTSIAPLPGAAGPAASGAPACRLCGRRPALELTLRRHVGMVVMQKFYKFRGPLCRDHARSLGRDYLNKTLLLGWWGLISFFVNFFDIFTDLRALSQASKLEPPS